jgi:hypothetical protein
MSELVQRLSSGEHEVEISIHPERTAAGLKRRLDQGYMRVKFTQTRGGTELYVPIDKPATDLSAGDFDGGKGKVRLVGNLTLDHVPVTCIAEIDLATLAGKGRLEPRATTTANG